LAAHETIDAKWAPAPLDAPIITPESAAEVFSPSTPPSDDFNPTSSPKPEAVREYAASSEQVVATNQDFSASVPDSAEVSGKNFINPLDRKLELWKFFLKWARLQRSLHILK
jgi:hypothetical protein